MINVLQLFVFTSFEVGLAGLGQLESVFPSPTPGVQVVLKVLKQHFGSASTPTSHAHCHHHRPLFHTPPPFRAIGMLAFFYLRFACDFESRNLERSFSDALKKTALIVSGG